MDEYDYDLSSGVSFSGYEASCAIAYLKSDCDKYYCKTNCYYTGSTFKMSITMDGAATDDITATFDGYYYGPKG